MKNFIFYTTFDMNCTKEKNIAKVCVSIWSFLEENIVSYNMCKYWFGHFKDYDMT